MAFERPLVKELRAHLEEPKPRMQVVLGPRQVGKTTAIKQILAGWQAPKTFESADGEMGAGPGWLRAKWNNARTLSTSSKAPGILVIDEIQKVGRWSETVKMLWDEEAGRDRPLRVVLLGSSALLVKKESDESLAGRFEVIRAPHWSYPEMKIAFGWDLDTFLYYGGYPALAEYSGQEARAKRYVREALIEPVLNNDILGGSRVDKPALLRHLFSLACEYGGQVLSYNRMLPELQETNSTVVLAHYQHLLERSWLIQGLQKYSGSRLKQRGSSPKWLPLATAFMTAFSPKGLKQWKADGSLWGRLVEVAVGSHLYAQASANGAELLWWRDGNDEVDYVVNAGGSILAVKVKSGQRSSRLRGLERFMERWPKARSLVVGSTGMALEEFLGRDLDSLLQ